MNLDCDSTLVSDSRFCSTERSMTYLVQCPICVHDLHNEKNAFKQFD
jgi:hypothetical protein